MNVFRLGVFFLDLPVFTFRGIGTYHDSSLPTTKLLDSATLISLHIFKSIVK